MANVFEMVFKAVDRATAPIRKINKATAGLRRGIMGIGKVAAKGLAIGAFAGLVGLTSILTLGVNKAIAYESVMADVKKVVAFESPQAFKKMGNDILEMSRHIPIAATGLAEIVSAAGQANIPQQELLKFADMAAKVGVAFDVPAGKVGDALAKIKTALRLSVADTGLLADAINHLSNNMASSAPQVLSFIRTVGSAGEGYGFTAAQTAAIGSAMIAAGAEADVAGTSFRNVGRALVKGTAATKAQRIAFKALGMNSTAVAKSMQADAVGTLIKVIEKIKALPKHMQSSTISQLFGDEARAIMPLINNMDLLKQSLDHVKDSTVFAGSAQREYDIRSQTTANNIQLMKNNLDAVGIAIGSRLLPPLNDALKAVNKFLAGMGDGTSGLEKALASVTTFYQDFTTGFSASFDGIKEKFSGVTTAFTSLGDTISSIFGKVTGESETFGSTIGKLVGGGLEAGLAGAKTVIKGLETVIKTVEPPIRAVIEFIGNIVTTVSEKFDRVQSAFGKVVTAFEPLSKAITDLFGEFGTEGNAFATLIGGVIVVSLEILAAVLTTIVEGLTWAIEKITAFVKLVKDGFSSIDWSSLKPDFGDWEFPNLKFWESDADKATKSVEALNKVVKEVNPAAPSFDVSDPAALEKSARLAKQIEASQKAIMGSAADVLSSVKTMVDQSNAVLSSVNWARHGERMMETLAAGMKSRAHAVVDQIRATMQEVRNHLPSSPAKTGPLSDIDQLKFSETIAKSIKSDPMVKAMRTAVAATRVAANDNHFGALARGEAATAKGVPSKDAVKSDARRSSGITSGGNSAGKGNSGGTTINYNPTITIEGGGADTEKRFAEMLREHSREIKKIVDGENSRVERRSYG